jgi:hypothetical protein
MPLCPRCRRFYGSGIRQCPDCEADLEADPGRRQELIPVYEPPDQMAAMTAVSLLEEHGIEAVAKSEQIAMYDGLAMMMRPRWGQVLVLGEHRQRAREILKDFLGNTAEAGPSDDSGED